MKSDMWVKVSCGYRVHVNSIDMNGSNARVCGGLGFCLDEPRLQVAGRLADRDDVPLEMLPLVSEFRHRNESSNCYELRTLSPLHSHQGLGSSTLLRLCVLVCLHELANESLTRAEATEYRLGLTSGIGLIGFFEGGLIVDGGYAVVPGSKVLNGQILGKAAPLLFRMPVPEVWTVYLAVPKARQSLDGVDEANFFHRVTPVSFDHPNRIAYEILMGIMPSLIENNLGEFQRSLGTIVGLGTKPHETKLHSRFSSGLLAQMNQDCGFAAVSSLGPSVYSITDRLIDLVAYRRRFRDFLFISSRVANRGYRIERQIELENA